MAGTTTSFTMTLADVATIATIIGVACGALGLYVRLFVSAEMVRQENRITEKIKLQFAEKEITNLQLKDIQKDMDEMKRGST